MTDTENFVNELYCFLQENRYIDKTPNAARKEMVLFNKLEKMKNSGSLSHDDYADLTTFVIVLYLKMKLVVLLQEYTYQK